jgi:hypothetical protein
MFFLKSIKPALISKSESVAENSLNLMLGFLENYGTEARVRVVRDHLVPTLMLVLRRHPQLADRVVASEV